MSCYTDGGVFVRRTASCVSAPCSAPGSPRSRVKFLCSHGGKILLRPSDGQLKYVGGETRVISVSRDISFQEVMKRLTYMMEGGMVLKYQLAMEDLDALVTVKSDEDLGHMFDEMEQYQMMGLPRMRTFLFPIHNHNIIADEQLPLDQRYIFSVNGAITPPSRHLPNPNPTKHLGVGSHASSGCTSPRSPDSYAAEANFLGNMHRIQSSPSICNLLNIPQQNNHYSPYHQLPPQYYHSSNTHSGYRSPNPHLSMRSGARLQQDNSTPPSYYNPSRDSNRGNEYCTKCMHHDNCGHHSDKTSIDRHGTLQL